MTRAILGILILLSTFVNISAQQRISWEQLADVTWSETYIDSLGYNEIKGDFGPEVLALNGQEVIISGYVIPLDAMGLSYALSRTSFASCFFCGQAGAETVMDLNVKPTSIPPNRQKEHLISFKGIFVVKESNASGLHYTLDMASELE